MTCPDCRGAQTEWSHRGDGMCAACHGTGTVVIDDPLDEFFLEAEECPKCAGQGRCPTCQSAGLIEEESDVLWDSGYAF